jgi:hypothetical protein
MSEKLACPMQVIKRTHIIETLSNSLSTKGWGLEERWGENMTNSLQYGDF